MYMVASASYTSASAKMFRISRPQRRTNARDAAIERYSETLIGEIASGWLLTTPITLVVERDEDGSYLASESITTVYGCGKSGPQAIQDYKQSLIEYSEILNTSRTPESFSLAARLNRYLARS